LFSRHVLTVNVEKTEVKLVRQRRKELDIHLDEKKLKPRTVWYT